MRSITSNPIIRLEFLRRFRSGTAAWGIPILTLVPGIAVTVAYAAGTNSVTQGGTDAVAVGGAPFVPFGPGNIGDNGLVLGNDNAITVDQVTSFGVPMFVAIFAAIVFALMILVPAVVGGSVSSERNNLTLQPLQLTALTPLDIVMGKLVASLAYLLLLLVCLSPVLAIPFLVGGVAVGTMLGAFGILVLVCVELAAVALAVSAVLKRPVTSIVTSLIVTGTVVVGPFIAMVSGFFLQRSGGDVDVRTSVYRLLACASPVSLFSWLGDIGDADVGDFAGTTGRVGSVVAWVVITVGALWIARRSVTAPVARDR